MNVCSLELSKQLWELSGWNPYDGQNMVIQYDEDGRLGMTGKLIPPAIPAYDLGFILRELPRRFTIAFDLFEDKTVIDVYYGQGDQDGIHKIEADTPENCAAKLCCILFEQSILTRKGEK